MDKHSDLLEGMTSRQTSAAVHWGSPSVISAGAGAGKTKVLTARVAIAIDELRNPEQVVAITFTNDAAGEMRSRVIDIVGPEKGSKCVITTFHSFAMYRVLAANWNHPYLRSLGCVSKTLKIEFSNMTLDHFRTSARANALTKRQNGHLSNLIDKPDAEFQSWLSLVRSYGYTPMTYFSDLGSSFASIEELCHFSEKLELTDASVKDYLNHYFLKCWVHYDGLLRESEVIDFDQVLVFSMLLLENEPEVRRKLKKRFKVFLVDEFQDTNVCQYRFLLQLVGLGEHFSMFGDIKQAIYSFRGSNCYLMANIAEQFDDITIYNLPDNFRSTQQVVAVGNKVAEHMSIQLVREPMIAHRQSVVRPAYRQFASENCEATWVSDKILELKGQGIAPQDIGILYRFNKTGQGMENYLISRNIPYRRLGSDKGLYEEDTIRDIVIFLHLLFHPFSPNVLNYVFSMFPQFGVQPAMLTECAKHVRKSDTNQVNNHQVLTYILNNNMCKPACLPQLKSLIQMIIDLSGATQKINTFDGYCRALNEQYANMDTEHQRNLENQLGDKFLSSRREVITLLTQAYIDRFKGLFEQGVHHTDTAKDLAVKNFGLIFNASFDVPLSESHFLDYVCTRPLIDRVKSKDEEENTTDIELMTIHSSKGLEKKAIFIIGASEQSWWRDPSVPDGTDAYEEELRLFYVALTRAVEHLSFTFSATREYNRQIERCFPLRFSHLLEDTVDYVDHVGRTLTTVSCAQDFIDNALEEIA